MTFSNLKHIPNPIYIIDNSSNAQTKNLHVINREFGVYATLPRWPNQLLYVFGRHMFGSEVFTFLMSQFLVNESYSEDHKMS